MADPPPCIPSHISWQCQEKPPALIAPQQSPRRTLRASSCCAFSCLIMDDSRKGSGVVVPLPLPLAPDVAGPAPPDGEDGLGCATGGGVVGLAADRTTGPPISLCVRVQRQTQREPSDASLTRTCDTSGRPPRTRSTRDCK
jgi:hypothetical protein